ncbi:MAG TPA: YjfB family protein [Rhodocyclaceae bacterium]|jgi:ferritin-like metal-binding protein YciE|nr:YjfB family protein [Betaproteobacteria bacterium]HMU99995.1 YjfB family protein [Rhodocyclaceae bacterium]HMV22247.1 YjfB family protein [Rhodocyclaceae bacterium]HMW76221.1 YjfB family protein [Rhodocyclaceae bacterium]HNE42497.1 YjfB family protein [Rhodocyclaceae bacterium]
MDLSGIGSLTTALSAARTGDAVALLTLKKTLDLEEQSAQRLIEALPQPVGSSNPAHLGNAVDITA